MTTTTAYGADPAHKAWALGKLARHRRAETLVQGVGWEDGKGCAIGCLFEDYSHTRVGDFVFGGGTAGTILARLEDAIFEGLPHAEATQWPERLLTAVPVGADMSRVPWQFLEEVLRRLADQPYAKDVRGVILQSADVVAAPARGEPIDRAAATAARAAAWTAETAARAVEAAEAARAAVAAAEAALTTRAAMAAAEATKTAAEAALSAAAAAEAARAAGVPEWRWMADALIELCEAAPVKGKSERGERGSGVDPTSTPPPDHPR